MVSCCVDGCLFFGLGMNRQTTDYEPSTINHQPSTINRELSIINHHLKSQPTKKQ
jgi:hypothetical protein